MAPDHNDLTGLFQRLADTLVRLFSERIDLARYELRDEAERILRALARLLLGAAVAAVGLVMLALAATELLSPFLPARALRLFVVGGPLFALGARRLVRAARALPHPEAPERDTTPEILLDDDTDPPD